MNQIHSLCVTERETRQQNGAVTRIETKRGFTRQKKRPPAQASTVLRVAFCLLRRALAFFLFYGELPIMLIVRSARLLLDSR